MKRTPMQLARALAMGTVILLQAGTAAAINVGEAAPAFTLPNGRGEPLALERLRGQIVYVDFWASWCGPCRRSFPWMSQMQKKYGSRGFAIVAINVDKKRSDAQRFLQQNAASFALVYDESGATPAAYGVKGMPSSYLIDARGNIAFIETGFFDERKDALEEKIKTLLAGR